MRGVGVVQFLSERQCSSAANCVPFQAASSTVVPARRNPFWCFHPGLAAHWARHEEVWAPLAAWNGKKAGDRGAAFFSLDDWDKLGTGASVLDLRRAAA